MNKITFLAFLSLFVFFQANLLSEDVLRPQGQSTSKQTDGYTLTGFDSRTPVSFGIEVGANLNLYSGKINVNQPYIDKLNLWLTGQGIDLYYYFNDMNYVFESGFGVSPHLGLFVDIPINESMGIGARLNYDTRSFGAKKNGYTENIYFSVDSIPFSLEYKNKFTYMGLNLNFRYNVSKEFFLTFGGNFDFLRSDEYSITYTSLDKQYPLAMTEAGAAIAENNYEMSRKITTTDGEFTKSSRFGLELGANYKINISKAFSLVPYARFQLYLVQPMNDFYYETSEDNLLITGETWVLEQVNSTLHALQLGLSLWFNY